MVGRAGWLSGSSIGETGQQYHIGWLESSCRAVNRVGGCLYTMSVHHNVQEVVCAAALWSLHDVS